MKFSIILTFLLLTVISSNKVTWKSEFGKFRGDLTVNLKQDSFTFNNNLDFSKTFTKQQIAYYYIIDTYSRGFIYLNQHIILKAKNYSFEALDKLLTNHTPKSNDLAVTLKSIDETGEHEIELQEVDLEGKTFTIKHFELDATFTIEKSEVDSYQLINDSTRELAINGKHTRFVGIKGDFEELDELLETKRGLVENITWGDATGEYIGELDIDLEEEVIIFTSDDNGLYRELRKGNVKEYFKYSDRYRGIFYNKEIITLTGDSFEFLDRLLGGISQENYRGND
jgi:hypothetical protein